MHRRLYVQSSGNSVQRAGETSGNASRNRCQSESFRGMLQPSAQAVRKEMPLVDITRRCIK